MGNSTRQELEQEIARLTRELESCRQRMDSLNETEEYYRGFFEHGMDGVVVLDPEAARPIHFNDRACQQLGYSREEFAGLDLSDIEAKEDEVDIRKHIDQVFKKGYDDFETLHRTKQGELRNVHISVQIIDVGSRAIYHTIWRDITESKLVEQALRESEEKFRLTFSFSPDSVTITRLEDGVYVDINEGFTRLTGFTREDVIGRSSLDLDIWQIPADREHLVRDLKTVGYRENLETQFRTKTGDILTGLMSARVISLNGVLHNISITRDITQHRVHEKERLKMEKLESLGILAGGIAHDFNNILTGILGNISFAKVLFDEQHQAHKPLVNAEKAAQRAGELAHQLLTFARGGEPIKKLVSPHRLLEETLSLTLHGSNVKGVADIPETVHAFEADEGQISQVFHNIIINGVQAMSEGGVLKVSVRNEILADNNIYSLSPGSYIRWTFADCGCGIEREDMNKIFDPYFTTKPEGSGLGLASAYSVIKKHDGHISVESTVGQGTTFTILLPSSGHPYQKSEREDDSHTAAGHRGHVLVMDDEEMIREIAGSMLAHLGYEVTSCSNGEEAVNHFRSASKAGKSFHAVFMDLTIPGGMGGQAAAEQILAQSPEACLVVSSGYSNDPIMSNYREFGFSAAIAKPYTIREFERILASLARRR